MVSIRKMLLYVFYNNILYSWIGNLLRLLIYMWGKFYLFLILTVFMDVDVAVAVEVPGFSYSSSTINRASVGDPDSSSTSSTILHTQYWLLYIVDQFIGCIVRLILRASDSSVASRTILSDPCYWIISNWSSNDSNVIARVTNFPIILQQSSAVWSSWVVLHLLGVLGAAGASANTITTSSI